MSEDEFLSTMISRGNRLCLRHKKEVLEREVFEQLIQGANIEDLRQQDRYRLYFGIKETEDEGPPPLDENLIEGLKHAGKYLR